MSDHEGGGEHAGGGRVRCAGAGDVGRAGGAYLGSFAGLCAYPAGALLDGQPAAVVDRVRRAYDQVSAAYLDPDGRLALPTAALLAAGTVTGP